MDKYELLQRIAKGLEYWHRTDITEEERKAAERKINGYRIDLWNMGEELPPVPFKTPVVEKPAEDQEKARQAIEQIRSMLQSSVEKSEKRRSY